MRDGRPQVNAHPALSHDLQVIDNTHVGQFQNLPQYVTNSLQVTSGAGLISPIIQTSSSDNRRILHHAPAPS